MDNFELNNCEKGIEFLAQGLGVKEDEIVKIIEDGLSCKHPFNMPENLIFFIEEMKATFDAY